MRKWCVELPRGGDGAGGTAWTALQSVCMLQMSMRRVVVQVAIAFLDGIVRAWVVHLASCAGVSA